MDKRTEKTLDSIYESFTKLINTKAYEEITIQDILDESKIGRSTFYTHFKTKNDLLSKVSEDIFEHVFSHSLQEEKSHDFSKESIYDYKHLITHILYHIKDEKELIKGILLSTANTLFLSEFKKYLKKFANSYFNNYKYNDELIPLELKKQVMIDNFITLLNYWISDDFTETPEKLTDYFIRLM